MSIYNTPLRYPGGKAKFAPFVKVLMEENNLSGDYLEPYAGGAGVALDLLFSGYCKNIHINDFDPAIFNFWKSVTENTEKFLKLITDTNITIEEWYKQKDILANPEDHSQLEHGFAAFFLNRTNRSGILKGGVIGGKNQDGNYKLDVRFNKESLSKRIERIGKHNHQIKVYNYNALELLHKVDNLLAKDSLIYLDPPYYVKGQGLYRNFYKHDDHVLIRNALDQVNTKWIVSYDNCQEIKDIYQGYRQDEYDLNYSAYFKMKGTEVMIYCNSIKPVNVSAKQAELEL
ncbi:DNA adenine methylase [Acinetobacter baumannii]|uniref:DNA adenine methylase n=1 Tax=Acinetobacter baumannii TaxID=470 RepID=UPI00144A64CC|nr:DNA adenine methylase [Acinetobacter baumannii]NLP55289.1 DNA adenine methylase [Acinetobacter baumannii]NQE74106.1 DNA-methyltransferase [Acinetobacter baumannii]QNT87677.1 DNA adenine methylase [Acinetobacter baumannii]WEX34674.1 DNA adenine methylase [Acinetobacter baumannii]WEX38048.1 DNA adenine methylase [Acinetobacter baumannii]